MTEQISKCISIIRFPMIVAILFIHGNIGDSNVLYPFNIDNNNVYTFVSELIGNGISRIGVPLFFFISGYLFFVGLDRFTSVSYIQKIKKRVRTLLVPYIIFNLAAVVIFGVLQFLMPVLCSGKNPPIPTWSITEFFIFTFWNFSAGPFVAPLWFVRNLFITALLSPVIYRILANKAMGGGVFVCLLYALVS